MLKVWLKRGSEKKIYEKSDFKTEFRFSLVLLGKNPLRSLRNLHSKHSRSESPRFESVFAHVSSCMF